MPIDDSYIITESYANALKCRIFYVYVICFRFIFNQNFTTQKNQPIYGVWGGMSGGMGGGGVSISQKVDLHKIS